MATIVPTKTVVYKIVNKLEISLDIYLPSNGAQKVPIFLWYHGGGLLQGHRNQLPPWLRSAANKYSIAIVSADYRFAPQIGIAEALEDVSDSVRFCRLELASHLDDPNSVDGLRLAVSGSSVGGYLALLAGLYVDPKPNVLAPIYPITDPLGTFFTKSMPPAMGRSLGSRDDVEEFLKVDGEVVANNEATSKRMAMYLWMQHDANLAKLWHINVGNVEDERKWRLARNIYQNRSPPTYIMHGDADTGVGVEQSDEVVGAMLGCGLEVVYERVHGKDHFFDAGPDYDNEVFWNFVLGHLK